MSPIMRRRGWTVHRLVELYQPSRPTLLGLYDPHRNIIFIKLRNYDTGGFDGELQSKEQLVKIICHELAHKEFFDHPPEFLDLWERLRDEHNEIWRGWKGNGPVKRPNLKYLGWHDGAVVSEVCAEDEYPGVAGSAK